MKALAMKAHCMQAVRNKTSSTSSWYSYDTAMNMRLRPNQVSFPRRQLSIFKSIGPTLGCISRPCANSS